MAVGFTPTHQLLSHVTSLAEIPPLAPQFNGAYNGLRAGLMTLTLTCDHRALDGAVASEFLGTLRAYLEEPALAL